jgi:hypothetical protein
MMVGRHIGGDDPIRGAGLVERGARSVPADQLLDQGQLVGRHRSPEDREDPVIHSAFTRRSVGRRHLLEDPHAALLHPPQEAVQRCRRRSFLPSSDELEANPPDMLA